MELDVHVVFSNATLIPKLNSLVVAHDFDIRAYNDEDKYRNSLIPLMNIEELLTINTGKQRLRVDPFDVYHKNSKFSQAQLDQIAGQTFMDFDTGVSAIHALCKQPNGTPSVVMIDIKDYYGASEMSLLAEKLQNASYKDVQFTIRCPSIAQFDLAIETLAPLKNV